MKTTCLLLALCPFLLFAQQQDLAVGTYTVNTNSHGIYLLRLDNPTGQLKVLDSIAAVNPSFLQVGRNKKRIWAVQEVAQGRGALVSFALPPSIGSKKKTATTNLDNTKDSLATQGDAPCHLAVNKAQSFAFLSNYVGGSLSVFALDKKGRPTQLVQLIQHQGKSVHPQRQTAPHVHSAFFSPDEKWLWVQDLGTDEVVAYPFDANNMEMPLSVKDKRVFNITAGHGPRHLAFHPSLPLAYVLEELTGSIQVLSTDLSRPGSLPQAVQSISLLAPGEAVKTIGAADIHVSSDGRFVYASNRGDYNEIVQFSVQPNGQLAFVARYPTGGVKPRNFTLSPNGNWLLVGNQSSHQIVVFARNTTDGTLRDSGQRVNLPAPVCLRFY